MNEATCCDKLRVAWDDADELAAALEETEQHWGGKPDGGSRRADEVLAAHRERVELRWPPHLRKPTLAGVPVEDLYKPIELPTQ